MIAEVKIIGKMDNTLDHTFECANRVYDKYGLSPTITNCGAGGNLQPKIIEGEEMRIEETECVGGLGKLWGKTQYHQQDRVYKGDVALAQNAQMPKGSYNYIVEEKKKYRIRKLTPLECWRLMGYTDEDFTNAEGVNSNTQLYKEAGNAIVKQVLMAIFSQMGIKGVSKWNDTKEVLE